MKELKEAHYDEKGRIPETKSVDPPRVDPTARLVFKHERPGMPEYGRSSLRIERGKAGLIQISERERLVLKEGQVKYAAEDASLGVWFASNCITSTDAGSSGEHRNSYAARETAGGPETDRTTAFEPAARAPRRRPRTAGRPLKDVVARGFRCRVTHGEQIATIRFQDAKPSSGEISAFGVAVAVAMEFFNSLSKTVKEYTAAVAGAGDCPHETVAKAKTERWSRRVCSVNTSGAGGKT